MTYSMTLEESLTRMETNVLKHTLWIKQASTSMMLPHGYVLITLSGAELAVRCIGISKPEWSPEYSLSPGTGGIDLLQPIDETETPVG